MYQPIMMPDLIYPFVLAADMDAYTVSNPVHVKEP